MEMEFFVVPGTDEEWHQYWIDERTRWYVDLGISRGQPAALRAPEGEAVALLQADRGHRVPVRLRRQRVGRAGGHRQPDRLRPARPTASTPAPTCPTSTRPTASASCPYVIEPAAGLTRSLMAFLVDAYVEDEAPNTKGGVDKRTVLRLDPRLAPVKVAVLPLSRNEALSPKARDLAAELRQVLERRLRRRPGDRPPLPPPGRDRYAVLRHRRLRHPRGRRGHHPRARLDEPGAGLPGQGHRLPGGASRRMLTPTAADLTARLARFDCSSDRPIESRRSCSRRWRGSPTRRTGSCAASRRGRRRVRAVRLRDDHQPRASSSGIRRRCRCCSSTRASRSGRCSSTASIR